ncbi:LptA/OstA family protein [Hyphobacterium sp.]|uniref:LptA/OstA family protein n=1 Tax=Hyphobacterium sp. TaxID=2004662 RepID=UPI003BA9CC22
MTLRLILSFFAALLLGGPALAQIGSQGGPLDISAERLETFDQERRAVFTGNVDAAQGDANLRSDRLEVFFANRAGGNEAGASWGEVERVIATGEVFYVTPDEVARGERAVYQLTDETIVMTGNVVLRRGENVITGACLVVDLTTNNSQINAPSCTGEAVASSNGNDGRVRAILNPERNNDPDDEDAEG